MKIVVIGGTGLIGSKVVGRLKSQGHAAIAAAPNTGVDTVTGVGLDEALAGADIVVDVSNSPSTEDQAAMDFFETSGRNIAAAEKKAGVKHHVALSVIGTERLQDSGYFRAKFAQELLIKRSPTPYTLIHAAQFFEFMRTIARAAHMADHRLDPAVCREAFGMATYVRDTEASKALSANPMPKVIISASGMATGGRVLHHIKAFGPNPRNTIMFAGFQTKGTHGRAIVDGVREVKIHGQWIEIRAEVADLTMFSAHADSNEIMSWLSNFTSPPERTLIVHGEPASSTALRDRIASTLNWSCAIPRMNERLELVSDEASRAA